MRFLMPDSFVSVFLILFGQAFEKNGIPCVLSYSNSIHSQLSCGTLCQIFWYKCPSMTISSVCRNREGSGETAHTRRLACVFAVRLPKSAEISCVGVFIHYENITAYK